MREGTPLPHIMIGRRDRMSQKKKSSKETRKPPKEKEVLIQVDERVRIVRSDSQNVEVQRLESNYNPKRKKHVSTYQFKGFHSTIESALRGIVRKELLIDDSKVSELEDYLKAIRLEKELIEQSIQSLKGAKQ